MILSPPRSLLWRIRAIRVFPFSLSVSISEARERASLMLFCSHPWLIPVWLWLRWVLRPCQARRLAVSSFARKALFIPADSAYSRRDLKQPMKKLLYSSLGLFVCLTALAQTNLEFQRTEDVIYGRKFGTALTLDVFQPPKPNGVGILFMVSGGWFSAHENINPPFYRPLLQRGYTVFASMARSRNSTSPKSYPTSTAPSGSSAITPPSTAWIPSASGSPGPAPAGT